MSRSRKKNPFVGFTTADSEKKDKTKSNKKLRRIQKEKLNKSFIDFDGNVFPDIKEVSNIYDFAKDGKKFYDNNKIKKYKKYLRK